MSKIVTDNSKVNYNLIEKNKKLKLRVEELKKQLAIPIVGCSYFTASDIGEKFEVIKLNEWHNFKLGETVTLKCVTLAEDDSYKFESDNDYWYLGFTDVKKL